MADRNNNPRNSENLLFRRLTRLLSGPLVNYRTQTGRRIRRIDLDKYSSRFKSASGQHFKKSGAFETPEQGSPDDAGEAGQELDVEDALIVTDKI